MKFRSIPVIVLFSAAALHIQAQKNFVSRVWSPDLGNGFYKNPVLNADYSDPDAIRVGDDFYLVSSSFEDMPGLPILHSRDLVNWKIIGHALQQQLPTAFFNRPRHGNGVWAPALRYRNGKFMLYYPDPDFGIYLLTAKNAAGPWSAPELVLPGKGIIDPCPFWDDDGKAYLIHAYAGSRAGIKSILNIRRMNAEGNKILDEGVLVYDGHETDPTIEGPKLYKRNGYYYILAPAGGVTGGWQLALRSKSVYGPYERKVVMDQGNTPVNGPHQGAWVNISSGEDWFLHFQDKGAYGRVVHLQPMHWKNDWPVIGIDQDGYGKGEPVLTYKKPTVKNSVTVQTPVDADDFSKAGLGLQWQWQANPQATWYITDPVKKRLRLFSQQLPDSVSNLWDVPNVLQQKFPADEFMITTKLRFHPSAASLGERAGVSIMGMNYAALVVVNNGKENTLVYESCKDAEKGKRPTEKILIKTGGDPLYLRVKVEKGGVCHFLYSIDGKNFTETEDSFTAVPGRWKGAKIGLFCTRAKSTNDAGWLDVESFSVEPLQ